MSGEDDSFRRADSPNVHNNWNASCSLIYGDLGHTLALFCGHEQAFAGCATDEQAMNPFFDEPGDNTSCPLFIQFALFVKGRKHGDNDTF
jgi:hypothetical protein